jgi:hypothetical protein
MEMENGTKGKTSPPSPHGAAPRPQRKARKVCDCGPEFGLFSGLFGVIKGN